MTLPKKQLVVKASKIPGAGKGLFTKELIPKGTRIVEYKGRITTWKEIEASTEFNAYVYYVSRNYVIDAKDDKKDLARYANDATGSGKVKGIRNNCKYVTDKKRVFIEAIRDIPAGEEILVPYGKEYWDVIKQNNKIDANKQKADANKQKTK